MKKALLLLIAGLCLDASVLFAQPSPEVLVPYRKGNKWGYCKLNKTIVIAPQFDEAEPFGQLGEESLEDQHIARVKKGDEQFWIDRKGKRKDGNEVDDSYVGQGIMMAELESGGETDREPKTHLQNGKAGLLFNGKVVLDYQYDSIKADYYTVAEYAMAKTGGKWGVVYTEAGKRGQWLLPARFDGVKDLMQGDHIFAVTVAGKQGVWNLKGEVLPPLYEQVALAGSNWHYSAIAAGGKNGWQLFGLNGKKLSNEVYEWAYTDVGNLAGTANGYTSVLYVKKNGKYGLLDNTGKTLTACKFDEIAQFYDKPFTLVAYKGKKGYIGLKGVEYFVD